MLKAIEETAKQTLHLIDGIKTLMRDYKQRIRSEFSNLYSQDLINNLFKHPYTKIEFLQRDLNISRQTASSYLQKLSNYGFINKIKIGKSNFYINEPLYNLLLEGVPSAQFAEPITTVTK